MTLLEILQDIHAMEEDLLMYERKYGILTDLFYESYRQGDEPPDDAWVMDWTAWAASYEIWLQRREMYTDAVNKLRATTPLATMIEKAVNREPILIPA
jgi:hypothetical protein